MSLAGVRACASCDTALSPLVFSYLPTVPLLLALVVKFLPCNLLGRGTDGENNFSHDLIMATFWPRVFCFFIKPSSVDFLVVGFGVGGRGGAAPRRGSSRPLAQEGARGPPRRCLVLDAASGPSHLLVLKLPAPEILTLRSNFNNFINYTLRFIGWSE